MIILLILGGLQFISMGLISELIVNRFRQGNQTPVSIAQYVNIDQIESKPYQQTNLPEVNE